MKTPSDDNSPAWKEYQIQVRDLFMSMGMESDADVEMQGVRGKHAVDVRVLFRRYGISSVWIVECKLWKTNVPKEKVLALQAIVQDLGADKGLLFSEKGFQAGAVSCARNSNILLTSVSEVLAQAEEEFRAFRIRRLSDELEKLLYELRGLPWRRDQGLSMIDALATAPPNYLEVFGTLSLFEASLKELRNGDPTGLVTKFASEGPVARVGPDEFLSALEAHLETVKSYAERYREWRPANALPENGGLAGQT